MDIYSGIGMGHLWISKEIVMRKRINHFFALWLFAQRYTRKDIVSRVGCSDAGLRYILNMNKKTEHDETAPKISTEHADDICRVMLSVAPLDVNGAKKWLKEKTGKDFDSYGAWGILIAMGYTYREVKKCAENL